MTGAITSGGQEFWATGTGTLVANNSANSFTQNVVMANGATLETDSLSNVGSSSSLGKGGIYFASGATTGKLRYTGGNASTDRLAGSLQAANNIIDVSNAATTLTVSTAFTATTGRLVKAGGGTANSSALSGATTLNQSLSVTQVTGGTLNLNANITSGTSGTQTVTFNNAGSVTQGGTSIIGGGTGTIAVTKAGAGTTTLSSANAYTGATTINGGVLEFQSGAIGNFRSATTITSGATLKVTSTAATTDVGFNWMAQQWYNAIVSVCSTANGPATGIPSGSATMVASGATLDLDGTQLTSGQLSGAGKVATGTGGSLIVGGSGNTTFSGGISGNGSVTKSGTGTLTLSGANTYTGTTSITSGTLKLTESGSIASSAVITVSSGATLDIGAGSTAVNGLVTLASGSAVLTLQNGAAATQVLKGGLTLNGSNLLNFDVGSTADCLALGGAYTAPTSGTVTVNINGITGFASGTYSLITGASGIRADSFTLGSTPSGHLFALVANAGTLSLVVDGIEAWRLKNFGTTSNAGAAADSADPDGDGMTNAQEFASETDPNDRTSVLKVGDISQSGNDMVISFATVAGKTYRVEASNALQSGSWASVPTGDPAQDKITGTGGTVHVTDTGGAAQQKRFYRIIVITLWFHEINDCRSYATLRHV